MSIERKKSLTNFMMMIRYDAAKAKYETYVISSVQSEEMLERAGRKWLKNPADVIIVARVTPNKVDFLKITKDGISELPGGITVGER